MMISMTVPVLMQMVCLPAKLIRKRSTAKEKGNNFFCCLAEKVYLCISMRIYAVLAAFFIAFYIQDRYAIFCIDDWSYGFMVEEDANSYRSVAEDNAVRRPVASLGDALQSQANDYTKSNGRFLVHTLVQFFCGTTDMRLFVVFNSLVFALFTWLVVRLTYHRPGVMEVLLAVCSIWLLLPHKGMTFMGNISMGVNYLWAGVVTLAFIMLFRRLKTNDSKLFVTSVTLLALISGSLQESFSIGLGGALVLYLMWNRKTVAGSEVIVTAAYVAGCLICMLSPANFNRFDDIDGMGFHVRSLYGLASSPVFLLFTIMLVVMQMKKRLRHFFVGNFLLMTSLVMTLLFVLFVAYNGRHQLTFVNVLSLILLLRGWQELACQRLRHIIVAVLLSLSVVSYYPILKERKNYYDCYESLVQRVCHTEGNTVVDGQEFEQLSQRIRNNYLLDCNYVLTFTFNNWDFYERALSIYLTNGRSNALVTTILPEDTPEYMK